jgi:hypothetical protein
MRPRGIPAKAFIFGGQHQHELLNHLNYSTILVALPMVARTVNEPFYHGLLNYFCESFVPSTFDARLCHKHSFD